MKTSLIVQNLKCHGCANTITKKLTSLDAISNVQVNVEENSVTFEYASQDDLEWVTTTLRKMGYPVEGENNSIGEKAKSYLSCAIGKI